MYILNIIQCTNLGGMEHSNLLRLAGVQSHGHAVRLVSLNPLGRLAPLLNEAGIPAVGLNYRGRFGWRSVVAMRTAFRRSKADAALMTGHNLAASIALAGLRVKKNVLAIHHHHFEPGMRSWHWPIVYSVAERVFDHVTFASDFIRREALTILPSLESISSVLPNPFELPPVPTWANRTAARARLGIPSGAYVVGNAGWLIPRKRFDVFIRVAAEILKTYQNVVFLIAGDGPERDKLASLAAELRTDVRVLFLGWQPDLNDFYQSLDVLLFNTDFDALGRTPLEAAARGVPVVASVIQGGLREVFPSEDHALVLDEHDIHRLSCAVMDLLRNPTKWEQHSRNVRERVGKYGLVDRHVQRLIELLTE